MLGAQEATEDALMRDAEAVAAEEERSAGSAGGKDEADEDSMEAIIDENASGERSHTRGTPHCTRGHRTGGGRDGADERLD